MANKKTKKYAVCDECPCFDGEFVECKLKFPVLSVENDMADFVLISWHEYWTVSDKCQLKRIECIDKIYSPLMVNINDIFPEMKKKTKGNEK